MQDKLDVFEFELHDRIFKSIPETPLVPGCRPMKIMNTNLAVDLPTDDDYTSSDECSSEWDSGSEVGASVATATDSICTSLSTMKVSTREVSTQTAIAYPAIFDSISTVDVSDLANN